MKRSYKKYLHFSLIVVAFLSGYFSNDLRSTPHSISQEQIHPVSLEAVVTRVVDGDTVVLEGGQRVRLIGVDAPELFDGEKLDRQSRKLKIAKGTLMGLGERSKGFLVQFIQGKPVRLEFDHELCDAFGRTLAYLYLKVGSQEVLVNQQIIADGFATTLKKYSFKKQDQFLKTEQQAQQANKGLWQEQAFRAINF
ncbi:MAG: thermonuclease family protein [Deltaproteobacteria bacterium]|nr:thermonuclease family protein [Deltaproteobacteria bacterium]